MDLDQFWLLVIEESRLSVSLIKVDEQSARVLATGPVADWEQSSPESFLEAFDQSLSQAALNAGLSEESEPDKVSLILPPFWLAHDGKIIKDKSDLISSACKKLKIKPMGFIASDDAIVEHYNSQEEYPSSYLLLGLSQSQFTLSLVYFGKIKSKIFQKFTPPFTPQILETALIGLNSTSTLPPQVIIYGDQTVSLISDLNNYPWVAKKDIETFLHLPNIEAIDSSEIIRIYSRVVFSQIKANLLSPQAASTSPVPVSDPSPPESPSPIEEVVVDEPEVSPVAEVDLAEMGFAPASLDQTETLQAPNDFPQEDFKPPLEADISEPPNLDFHQTPESQKPQVFQAIIGIIKDKLSHLPKPKPFPLKKFRHQKIILILISILPLFLLIPFLFSQAKITAFITPYNFDLDTSIVLDSTTSQINSQDKIIPVVKKSFPVSSSITVPTTGTLTIGEKAKGEITVYNKTDQAINLPQSAALKDNTGKTFELLQPVSVEPSTSDLDQGVINLGKAQATVIAQEIGPEYNLDKDAELVFANYSRDQLIAKVSQSLTGGTKEEVRAVAKADKDTIESQLNDTIRQAVDDKINQELGSLQGLIMDSVKSSSSRIEYGREVGEQADELSASIEAEVSAFAINPDVKPEIITSFLSSQPNFDQADIDSTSFDLTFKIDELENTRALATMKIVGSAKPKLNQDEIKKNISGKSQKKAREYLNGNVKQAYNFNIQTNFAFLKFINPLPFRADKITIETKIESR